MQFRYILKHLMPKSILRYRRLYFELRRLNAEAKPLAKRFCPICKYEGFFEGFGVPRRIDARCPNCGSLERHRLFWLWYRGEKSRLQQPILHFAPEAILEKRLRCTYDDYQSANLVGDSDLCLNIENIELRSNTIKTVICNHVLEHVDDKKALLEIRRILTQDGVLICSVPIIEGWEKTYENKDVKTKLERELHFGQHDHVRYYGRDFRERLKTAGFSKVVEHTAQGESCIRYGLLRGETIFICSKS